MPRFFLEEIGEQSATIYGEDARHISKSLRMREGEALTLCDMKGKDYRCVIEHMGAEMVEVRVLESFPSLGEPACRIRLYQALPKGDKMELIVQKATELGVDEIVPLLTDRCISRPNLRTMEKKRQRYQKIAFEAAKQSGRGKIPQISELQSFEQAVADMRQADLGLLFYEESDVPLRQVLTGTPASISILVGCEGGIAGREASLAREAGIHLVSLGSRILRCETAPICALSAILFFLGEY